jgi:uncharacterized cupin superfamily protein
VITHWDELASGRRESGHIAATWTDLTGSASVAVGLRRIAVDPDHWSTPLHVHAGEEEIFFVLSGAGLAVQGTPDRVEAHEITAGDCVVYPAGGLAHSLRAGPSGLTVLAFGERRPMPSAFLPRIEAHWLGRTWTDAGGGASPFDREGALGPIDVPAPTARPPGIVHVDDVAAGERAGATVGRQVRGLGAAAGARRTGLSHYDVLPGMLMNPPHCHSAEEEIFVVLEGAGTLTRWPHPRGAAEPERFAAEQEQTVLRPGHTVAIRPGSGRAHSFTAAAGGLRLLAFSNSEPNDICFYPRSGKVSFRGIGVIGRIDPVAYWDGED